MQSSPFTVSISRCAKKVMRTKEVNEREGANSPDQRTVEVFQMVVQQQV
jgi:hypothetical protein